MKELSLTANDLATISDALALVGTGNDPAFGYERYEKARAKIEDILNNLKVIVVEEVTQ